MKYIIVCDHATEIFGTPAWPKGGQISSPYPRDMPILLPDDMTHSVVFDQLKASYPGLKAVSAGFCGFTEDGWYTEGRSTSLNLESLPGDYRILHQYLFTSVEGDDE